MLRSRGPLGMKLASGALSEVTFVVLGLVRETVLTTPQGVTGFDFDLTSQVKRAEDCGHNLVNPVTAKNKCQ